MVLGNIDSLPQKAAPTRPRWGHFMGRLIWLYPKGVKPAGNGMGDSIICDVGLLDGGTMTHVTDDDGIVTSLVKPVQEGEVVEDVYVSSSRFKEDLRAAIGQHDGFICRLAKDGRAAVLRKATPDEEARGMHWLAAYRGRQQQVAAAANPFTAAQAQLAAQQPQYGQQFPVPPAPGQFQPAAGPPQGYPQQQPQYAVGGQQYPPQGGGYGAPAPQPTQAPFTGQPGGPPAVPGAQPGYNPNQGYGQPAGPQYQQPQTAGAPPVPNGYNAGHDPVTGEAYKGAPPFDPAAWAAFQAAQGQSGQPPF